MVRQRNTPRVWRRVLIIGMILHGGWGGDKERRLWIGGSERGQVAEWFGGFVLVDPMLQRFDRAERAKKVVR